MIFLFNKNYKSLLSSLQMHEHSFIEAILSNIENREKIEKYFKIIGTSNPKHLKRYYN